MLHDHAELAASEQVRREAAWAGGSVDCGTFLAALSASERLFRRPARSRLVSSTGLPLLPTLLPSQNTTGFDQDYVAGLDAFDYYLLEKRMLLEATLRKQPSARPVYPAPGGRAASAQAVEPAVLMLAVLALQRRPPRLP